MKKAPRRIRIATALTVLVILALVFAGRLPLLPRPAPRFCALPPQAPRRRRLSWPCSCS